MTVVSVETVQDINPGEKVGKIVSSVVRSTDIGEKQVSYTDYDIEIENGGNIKVGFPTHVTIGKDGSPKSDHAKFLKTLGVALNNGEVETTEVIGKTVKFFVKLEEKNGRQFAKVVKDSITEVSNS